VVKQPCLDGILIIVKEIIIPNSIIKSYAIKSGHSVDTVEKYWEEAKKSADGEWKGKKKDEHYWAYVSGIVKKRCGLTESLTFKEFVELSFDNQVVVSQAGSQSESSDYGMFISSLFAARDKAHELHLASRSHSQHVALNELYELLVEFADKMTEAFQGKHGLIKVGIPAADALFNQQSANTFIDAFTSWLETTGRHLQGDDSFMINMFEELLADVYRIKYKLDNLK
jgi:hypothetical protein